MESFVHLHVHSQYSILDGQASIGSLVNKAQADGMKALALTDHGTMFGIKEFWNTCKSADYGNRDVPMEKWYKVKPILGCETYVAERGIDFKQGKEDRSGDHLILLAKNETGYRNLLRLISIANIEGMYYKPRIDKSLLEKYHEGLIVSSACLGGEIPQKILNGDIQGAEEAIKWFKSVFGNDYYLEIQRHPAESAKEREEVYDNQVKVNKVIIELAQKLDVKIIATNDVHFTNQEDANAHDILICLNTGKNFDDANRMRYTKQEWFKTTAEMNELFADVPLALQNTQEIADKIEVFELDSDPIMPQFPIPESFAKYDDYLAKFKEEDLKAEFTNYEKLGGFDKVLRIKYEADYLHYLVMDGAKKRYPDKLDEVLERIEFELDVIKQMGFPGYFLIVRDFIQAARDMGVIVGPGRGSAAGSAAAYCIKITNVDPIKYDLLFERFLNPDRISMPDIDIDFDDDGRQQVMEWVTEKYGREKVSHICTFGTMAAKMAIRDVARVLQLPLPEADRLAKMVPETPKITLKKAYEESPELEIEKKSTNPLIADTIRYAEALEGCIRQTGVHACGVIIGRDPLYEHIPLMPTKDESLFTTQYDGRFVEAIGLLKMDFLGLKTLSIIKECLENIKLSKGIDVDIDNVPMDDTATYELFSRGDTTAVFQFESPGMKKWLRLLQPNRFDDLVAMNALYRPGPMEYIPNYVERKHGRAEIVYDHPLMEPYLKDTYGVTVYQEQVMLQSRALGGFTRGQSDTLRKAMGKKNIKLMDKLKEQFTQGCIDNPAFIEGCNGRDPKKLVDKIWKDWEAFAQYAFNKSHAVCYAYVAYQTGYLKAHYPAEFMAAVLSRNLTSIERISTFMDECKAQGINVLGPDVNESYNKFTVNKKGEIRFGMSGIKGVGGGAVDDIVAERKKRGDFKDIWDFAERVNLQSVNKKNWEALAYSGAFDLISGCSRAQFFEPDKNELTFIENLIRYGNLIQNEKSMAQQSLFGGSQVISIQKPKPVPGDEWPAIVKLDHEKNMVGIYLTAHPLDTYKLEINSFCTKGVDFSMIDADMAAFKGRDLILAGMVTEAYEGMNKKGNRFSSMTLSDYRGQLKIFFFGNDYINFGKFCQKGLFLMVRGKILPRFRSSEGAPEMLEFKVQTIDLLQEVRTTKVKALSIEVDLQVITDQFIEEFFNVCEKNKGQAHLDFKIFDPESKSSIEMFSRNIRINPDDGMIDYLNHKEGIIYKIN
ncbi:MAG TPA: DNA polymerase III subunit alpha [Prolixibacteraceae bacterium]|nr:DNA polymerase III subunit alpha [Prolixibacteraceae bacterium]HPS12560.1 DNA polymerase III subunit alpha [Prolixibacteraceae bacterium]